MLTFIFIFLLPPPLLVDGFMRYLASLESEGNVENLFWPTTFCSSLSYSTNGVVIAESRFEPRRNRIDDLSLFSRLFFAWRTGPHFVLVEVTINKDDPNDAHWTMTTHNPAQGNTQYSGVESKIRGFVSPKLPNMEERTLERVRRSSAVAQQDDTSCGFYVCLYAKELCDTGNLENIPSTAEGCRRRVRQFLE
jgi:hypothetical protein